MTETLRPLIADSWRRADLAGLDPVSALVAVPHAEIDPRRPLAIAAGPVLDDLEGRLTGTGLITMLVDPQGRMVRRWSADKRALRAFDNLGVGLGASLLEGTIGTTAPGIVLETRERPTSMARSTSPSHSSSSVATPFRSFTRDAAHRGRPRHVRGVIVHEHP